MRRIVSPLLLLMLVVPGCGKPPSRLIPVEGKVLVDGKPLTRGTVIFSPDASRGNNSPHEPRGNIDETGTYRLGTPKEPGVPAGWYKIAVIAQVKTNPNDPYSYVSLIPHKYNNADNSGIVFEVVENPAAGAYDIKLPGKKK